MNPVLHGGSFEAGDLDVASEAIGHLVFELSRFRAQ